MVMIKNSQLQNISGGEVSVRKMRNMDIARYNGPEHQRMKLLKGGHLVGLFGQNGLQMMMAIPERGLLGYVMLVINSLILLLTIKLSLCTRTSNTLQNTDYSMWVIRNLI